MVEIRKTRMCDVQQKLRYTPSQYLPWLDRLFGAFIAYVGEHVPAAVEEVRASCAARFAVLSDAVGAPEFSPPLEAFFSDMDGLRRARLRYVCGLVGFADGDPHAETRATRLGAAQARLYPAYHQMRALADTIGRDEAVQCVKAFVDDWMARNTRADETLEDPGRFFEIPESGEDEVERVSARLGRGKIAFRTNRCLWADVLATLDDAELAHAGACYGDFQQMAAVNPNIVFTRTMTLVQGDPYCDSCIHDRRFVDSIEHPSREFYDSLL